MMRDLPPAWSLVRFGLSLTYGAMLIAFIASFFFFTLSGISFLQWYYPFSPGVEAVMRFLALTLMGILLAFFIVGGIGRVLCCCVPTGLQLRGVAVASLICQGLGLLLITIVLLSSVGLVNVPLLYHFGFTPGEPNLVLCCLAAALFVGGHLLFVMFLANTAHYLGDTELPDRIRGHLLLAFPCAVGGPFLALVIFAAWEFRYTVLFMYPEETVTLLAFVLVLGSYVRVLRKARTAVARALHADD
jgi:hypothetical protein